jgi:hypothetical protein
VFQGCSSLQSLAVPSSLEVIDEGCFAKCKSHAVVRFELDSKLARIDERAFQDCSSLRSFFVPGRVECIGVGCFVGCSSLTTLDFEHPCNLRELLNLPPRLSELQTIPDSVEVLQILADPNHEVDYVLQFGSESKLAVFQHRPLQGGCQLRCFLRVPGQCSRRFRDGLEFVAAFPN